MQLLNEINFNWDPFGTKWEKQFNELKSFFKKNGHSLPNTNDSEMGRWVCAQRRLRKNENLEKDRIKLLNSLDFVWDISEKLWNDKLNELKEFKGSYDQLNKDKPLLNNWVKHQRQYFKKGKLSKERIKLLESLEGWEWLGKSGPK